MNNTQLIINKQPKIVQEKPFIRKVIKAYRFGDNHVKIWNDATVVLVSEDLEILARDKHDPEELSDVIEMFDNLVEQYNNKRHNNGVEM